MWRRPRAIARAAGVRHRPWPRLTAPVATRRRLEYVYQSGYGRGGRTVWPTALARRGEGIRPGRVQGRASPRAKCRKGGGRLRGFGAGHGHRDGYEQGHTATDRAETGREDGRRRGAGLRPGPARGQDAEGKDVGIAERSEGQRLGFETGVQEGLAKGRHEGFQHGHAGGYDERAHFEAEARRLAALPRFVRPPEHAPTSRRRGGRRGTRPRNRSPPQLPRREAGMAARDRPC